MVRNNILFKNITYFNKYLLIVISILIVITSGLTSYAIFTHELTGTNDITITVKEMYTQESCFTYTGTTELTITGYKCYAGNSYGLSTIIEVVMPNEINGIPITKIIGNDFENKGIISFVFESDDIELLYDYDYTGNYQTFTSLLDGYYEIELWGAQGGGIDLTKAQGGYTKGTIYLQKNEKLYVHVGNKGSGGDGNCDVSAAYNGGSISGNNAGKCGFFGGGATDIRLVSGAWNNIASLKSRIMVAGAGGGSNGQYTLHNSSLFNSNGGGLIAPRGAANSINYEIYVGYGGAQISGGIAPIKYTDLPAQTNGNEGVFGVGGIGGMSILNPVEGGGSAGGGGYYGGSGASGLQNGYFGGGGGSSYISGYTGANSVLETGGTVSQPLHSNNTIHYSGKYFINGSMEIGVNVGNGKVKMKYIGLTKPARPLNYDSNSDGTLDRNKFDEVRYIKTCNSGSATGTPKATWLELQVIKDGKNLLLGKSPLHKTSIEDSRYSYYSYTTITDGIIESKTYSYGYAANSGIQCLVYDLGSIMSIDEIAIWSWHFDGRLFFNNSLSLGTVDTGVNTNILPIVLHSYSGTNGYLETSQGKRYTAWD